MDIVGGQKWGSLVNKETNSFNGMIGMVQRKVHIVCLADITLQLRLNIFMQEADLAMGAITHTQIRDTAVDFSFPYFFTGIGFYSKKPYRHSKFLAILWPFDIYLWLALIAAVPTTAAVYWIFALLHYKGVNENISIGTSLSQVLQILVVSSGSIRWPSYWHTRVIMTSWALFACVIIFGGYRIRVKQSLKFNFYLL